MQKITLIGNLGRDPETRRTPKGNKVINFSLAARCSKDSSQWYDITIWEDKIPQFEKMLGYLKKGSNICVIGELGMAEAYSAKDGSLKVRLRVTPDSLNFVNGGGASGSPSVKTHGAQFTKAPQRKDEELYAGPGPDSDYDQLPF